MALPFMLTDESLTVQFIDGPKTIRSNSPHFKGLVAAIKSNEPANEVRRLFSLAEAVKKFSEGNITIENDIVKFKGQEIKNSVSNRILSFMSQGLPWQPLARFLENLMANPSRRAVEYLYNFLEYGNLAITEDGHFLAYKAVRNDYMDKHSGKFLNIPTAVLSMQRNQVCDDPDLGCSYGFHVGSLEYVRGFACGYGEEGGDRIIIVKTNPADVVSVPHDCEYQKVRTAKYLVVSEYTGPLPEYVPDERDEDNSDSFDGIHVSVSCDCDCDCEDEDEDFEEEFLFTSSTSDGHPVSKYKTNDYDDSVLWDMARKAVAAGLKISVIDQDGCELKSDMLRYL